MSVVSRITDALRRNGARGLGIKAAAMLHDRWFDLRHGIETCSAPEKDKPVTRPDGTQGGFGYEPSRTLPLRQLFRSLQPLIRPESVLVDVGCGKGKAMFVASQFGFRTVRGIELSPRLCELARANAARWQARAGSATHFEIIQADLLHHHFAPDEDFVFCFNPFGEALLSCMLDKLEASQQAHPRPLCLLYFHPVFARVIDQRPAWRLLRELRYGPYSSRVYTY